MSQNPNEAIKLCILLVIHLCTTSYQNLLFVLEIFVIILKNMFQIVVGPFVWGNTIWGLPWSWIDGFSTNWRWVKMIEFLRGIAMLIRNKVEWTKSWKFLMRFDQKSHRKISWLKISQEKFLCVLKWSWFKQSQYPNEKD